MRKITALLISLLALFGTVISAKADAIAAPTVFGVPSGWLVVLVLLLIIVTLTLLRIFRKK